MASAATYRIGPSDVFTSGDLEADAATLDGQVSALDDVIAGNTDVPTSFVESWLAWEQGWRSFYSAKFQAWDTFLVAFNDGNRDQLVSFENQYQSWYDQSKAFGAQPAGANVTPSTGTQDTLAAQLKQQLPSLGLPSLTTVVVLIVAIIVAVVVWKA